MSKVGVQEILQSVLTTDETGLRVQSTGGGTPGVSNKATFVRGLKAPAATNTPEALAASATYVTTVTIWAQRAARAANAGNVYLDTTSGDGTQLIEMTPGSYITFTAPPGKYIDLSEIYVDAVTLTDGVYFLGLL